MEDLRTGNIYYNKYLNLYYVIAHLWLNHYSAKVLVFEGYETNHDFVNVHNISFDELEKRIANEDVVQVGGIY